MSPLFTVITIGVSIIIGYTIYIIMDRKHQAKTNVPPAAEPMLDDTSYIQEMKHLTVKVGIVLWQQYDFLLAARPYCWEYMVEWADYMETADFDDIDSMTVGAPGENDLELAHVYNQNKVGLKNFERLKKEMGSLSIAGHSRTLNDSVKIVWYNQTRVLRVFTLVNDETLITKYVETFIRRTFGTPDAMKLAKPVDLRETV